MCGPSSGRGTVSRGPLVRTNQRCSVLYVLSFRGKTYVGGGRSGMMCGGDVLCSIATAQRTIVRVGRP